MFSVKSYLILWIALFLLPRECEATRRTPVVIIPGTGGNRLEAKLTGKKKTPAWYCLSSTITFFTLWFDTSSPIPSFTKCWVDNIRLEWDMEKKKAHNVQGVVTRVPDFGSTDSMECLDTVCLVPYMKSLIEYLISIGYEKDNDLMGAPYDFRYSPGMIPDDYFERLKTLIEMTYQGNENRSVTLLTHSYGGVMALYFLNMTSTEWKKKYIKQWIPISAPFGGSIFETLVYSSGFVHEQLENVVKPLEVREAQRTYTSNLVLLPSIMGWDHDYVFANTKEKNFTVSEMKKFLHAVGFESGATMLDYTINTTSLMMSKPGVPVHCFYGNKPNSTIKRLVFDDDFPDKPSSFVYGDGDDTVNIESLVLCEMFADSQNETVNIEEIPGVGHIDILENDALFGALKTLLGF